MNAEESPARPSGAGATKGGRALSSTLIVMAHSTPAIANGAITLFLPVLRVDLGITFSQAGLVAALSILTYALAQLPAGFLADRISPTRLFAVGLLGANLFAVVLPITGSLGLILMTQALAGAFRAFAFAPGLILVTRQFSASKRATAMSLLVAAGFLSNILISVAGPVLVVPLGWRSVVILSTCVATAALIAFWLFSDEVPAPERTPARASAWVWRTRAWWLLGIVQFARLATMVGFTSWLPAFLVEDRGLSLASAGLIVAFAAAITALFNIGGGLISDRLERPVLVIGTSLAGMAVLFAIAGHVPGTALLVAVVVLIAVFLQLYFGALFVLPRTLFGAGLEGLSAGFGNMFANIGGFSTAVALGMLKDATGTFTSGFHVLAGVALVGFISALALRVKPRSARPQVAGNRIGRPRTVSRSPRRRLSGEALQIGRPDSSGIGSGGEHLPRLAHPGKTEVTHGSPGLVPPQHPPPPGAWGGASCEPPWTP